MGNQQESSELQGLIPIPVSHGYFTDGEGNVFSIRRTYLKRLKSIVHYGRSRHPYRRISAAGKLYLAHRFIASVLVKRELKPDEQVNHLDGDTENNALLNLEVVSHRDNVRHAVQNGMYCSGDEWYRARGMLKD